MDTLPIVCFSLLFGLLFATAGLHKARYSARFAGILRDYRLLPATLTPLLSPALAAVELALAMLWLASLAWPTLRAGAALGSALLLATYGLAMAINLLRGRRHIDCGCGFRTASLGRKADSGVRQLLSGWLLLRNLLLIMLALGIATGPVPRALTALDWFSLLLAVPGFLLLYGAAHQLLANRDIILSWRGPGVAPHA